MYNLISSTTPLAPYQIFWVCLAVAAGIIVIWQIMCLAIARYILHMACTPRPHTFEEVRSRQTATEHTDYSSYDNVWNKRAFEVDGVQGKIRGEVIFNDQANKDLRQKVAVICHGHTMNRLNSLKYADIFYNKGYNVIIYDHRYFGESDGKYCTMGYHERTDLSHVIDYARETFGKDCFVALHGESMGAVTVLLELGLRSDIDFVVADCPFSDTEQYYRELFEHLFHIPSTPIIEYCASMAKTLYKYDFAKCSPILDVKNSAVPVCFIHGKADDFIYPHHSVDMYAESRNPLSELHLVPDAGHARSHLQDSKAYADIVGKFADKIENVSYGTQPDITQQKIA